MAVISTGEDYEKYFDIDCYMNFIFVNPAMGEVVEFLLQGFHEAFGDGRFKGRHLLDIGSGPAIHCVISASKHVDEIYLSDYSKRLVDKLKKWQKGEVQIQEKQVQRVCEIENKGQTAEDRMAQIRSKVRGVAHIDITNPNSLTGCDVPEQFDIITSCGCLESAGQTIETYRNCVENIYKLMKPGGYLVLFGNLNCSNLTLDNNDTFPIINISEVELRKIYVDVGFEICTMKTANFNPKSGDELFIMTAQRKQ